MMLINIRQLAYKLKLPTKWLQQEAESGRIPSLKVMDGHYFDPEVVEKVLADRAKLPANEANDE